MSEYRKRQLSHESFFRLCEEARNRREQIEKMTDIDAVTAMCGQAIGVSVSPDAMVKAMKCRSPRARLAIP